MPVLKKIVVQDFRNIILQELNFSGNINCVAGGNGEGKTNLLEAVYYLSMTKNSNGSSDKFNFRYGTDSFSIAGVYRMENGLDSRFSIKVGPNAEKKVKRDDKVYSKIADHVGTLPIVMVSPADISLVSENGEERRRFVNSVLSQMDREYLAAMQQYNRILAQRNMLLKDGEADESLLSVFDEGLSRTADIVFAKRKAFIGRLSPMVSEYYKTISGGKEAVDIAYKSELFTADMRTLLKERHHKDLYFKYTTAGVQRDDFIFSMNGYPIRKCGSQGQQKSFLVALKFAQYDIMKQDYGYAPILLLDDLFDKLDYGRISNLLKLVAGNDFGQIFLSDCDRNRLSGIVEGITAERAYFEARGGEFTPIDPSNSQAL